MAEHVEDGEAEHLLRFAHIAGEPKRQRDQIFIFEAWGSMIRVEKARRCMRVQSVLSDAIEAACGKEACAALGG